MNWQPLISRWRVEADRRQQQLEAARGTSAVNATEQAAIIRTLRKCAEQAEKSYKRQQQRRRQEREQAEAEFLGEPGSK